MLHRRGERLHQRTNGPSRWQLIALSPAALATFCKTEAGYEQTLPSLGQVLRPPPSDLRRLLRLCGEAARLAETRPEVLRHPAILRAMECELAGILARCLLDGEERAESPGMRRAADVMTRLEGVLAAHSPRTLPAVELCQVLGVSEHTLRLYCASFLGFGARRYIQLRRLRLVRAALLGANPQKAQITELATRGGFSKRSRFTRLYKAIYCETPAETLRRAGDA
jgi:AraC-like DNA-binding protein